MLEAFTAAKRTMDDGQEGRNAIRSGVSSYEVDAFSINWPGNLSLLVT